jgi:DNA polymerase-4
LLAEHATSRLTLAIPDNCHVVRDQPRRVEALWKSARAARPRSFRVVQIGVTLSDIPRANERQLDILLNDDVPRRKWESATAAIDGLNRKYGRTLVSVGPWTSVGEFAGGKISYTRIPRAEDFW